MQTEYALMHEEGGTYQLVVSDVCQHAYSVVPMGTVHHGGQLHSWTFAGHAPDP